MSEVPKTCVEILAKFLPSTDRGRSVLFFFAILDCFFEENIWGRPINCWLKMVLKKEGNTEEGKVGKSFLLHC